MKNAFTQRNISIEIMSAVFIIAFISFFILVNLIAGFNLPVYLFTIPIAALISFFYPRGGLYAIVFLTFIFERFFTLQPIIIGRMEYKFYPLDAIFIALLAGIAYKFIKKEIRFNFLKTDYYLIAFIALVFINFFISLFGYGNDFALSFSSLKNYALYSLFYFAVVIVINKYEYAARLFKFAFAGAALIIFFIVIGAITQHGIWSDYTPLSTEGVRLLAFTHGFYLTMAFLAAFIYLICKKSKHGMILFVLSAIWIIGIIGSMMRHLWLSLFISVSILVVYFFKRKKRMLAQIVIKYTLAAIAIAALMVYSMSLFPKSDLSRAAFGAKTVVEKRADSFLKYAKDESFSWRNTVWTEAIKQYAKKPVFGFGFGKKLYVETENYRNFVEARNIHNSLIALLVQSGLITSIIFIIFIYKTFRQLIIKKEKNWIDVAVLIMFINYLIAFLFQPYLETNMLGIFFWILLGLMRSSVQIKSELSSNSETIRI
ncbi:MAG: hypothetical protein A3J63_01545 [Candidatus Moranbacteria bacterium RIFCSPHIGHO2_02_FULL_40_12b]|nr:MAG: hypothetical protein A3J63_01545 [Candidatus Moranbacteria bacterium RIFCSPHIGHO2_02_FULL_40_12b]OGI23503.1 MAG: hypothetical protein A3E91_01835 [Candidatus Moranbacteria bacterium RIFCSPHIGHO2_12_FULL_40_10]